MVMMGSGGGDRVAFCQQPAVSFSRDTAAKFCYTLTVCLGPRLVSSGVGLGLIMLIIHH